MLRRIARQRETSAQAQLDATELVRRAERALGVSVRRGQADGTVETPLEGRARGGQWAEPSTLHRKKMEGKPRPLDFAPAPVLSGPGGIYQVTDGVPDEMHEQALAEARAEGNLARANVGCKIEAAGRTTAPGAVVASGARWPSGWG